MNAGIILRSGKGVNRAALSGLNKSRSLRLRGGRGWPCAICSNKCNSNENVVNSVLMNDTQNLTPEQTLAQNIEGFLQKLVETSEPLPNTKSYYAGRPTTLPSLVLWSGVLVTVLRGFTSQLDIWRIITWNGFWSHRPYQISDQAVYNRLANGGNAVMRHLFYQVRDGLKARFEPYAQTDLAKFASGVYAIDGSTLDKMRRYLPWLRAVANGDNRLLPGKMVALFDLRQQQWTEMIHLDNPNQNDKVVAQELVDRLPAQSLILADLGFFSFAWFDYLTAKGFWWISRLREKTSYEVIHTYSQSATFFDGLIWLGKYRADQAAYAVRLVQFTIGSVQYQYLTFPDPEQSGEWGDYPGAPAHGNDY